MDVRYEKIRKTFGGLDAVTDLDLHVPDGSFLALLGPSGCGKTTALRILAGLEEPTSGRVFIGPRDVTDLQPKDRDVAMVFQSYALYPHKNVRDNIGYPLRVRKVARETRDARAAEVARMLDIDMLLDRTPRQLSGGQRQRVALARAIVREPQAFLMDEPLSNLDAQLRLQMRAEIKRLQRDLGTTTVYVTHDQVEAMTMGHRVAVLRDGRLQQCAPPRVLYDQPVNVFVAGFIGSPAMNLCRVPVVEGTASLGGDAVALPGGVNGRSEVVVGLRPEALELGGDGIPGRVEVLEELGADVYAFCLAQLPAGEARLVARTEARHAPERGERVSLRPRMEEAHLFDVGSGARLEG